MCRKQGNRKFVGDFVNPDRYGRMIGPELYVSWQSALTTGRWQLQECIQEKPRDGLWKRPNDEAYR